MKKRFRVPLTVGLIVGLGGCLRSEEPVVLPEAEEVEAWFDGAAAASLDGRRLVIEAVMEPDHLARGGLLWLRATPYFYLFNAHVRQVLLDYPSVEGVDVVIRGDGAATLARVSLDRSTLTIYEWDRALAYTARAQRDGTEQPRFMSELLRWAEERVDHEYTPPQ